jgi:hypothetical protein
MPYEKGEENIDINPIVNHELPYKEAVENTKTTPVVPVVTQNMSNEKGEENTKTTPVVPVVTHNMSYCVQIEMDFRHRLFGIVPTVETKVAYILAKNGNLHQYHTFGNDRAIVDRIHETASSTSLRSFSLREGDPPFPDLILVDWRLKNDGLYARVIDLFLYHKNPSPPGGLSTIVFLMNGQQMCLDFHHREHSIFGGTRSPWDDHQPPHSHQKIRVTTVCEYNSDISISDDDEEDDHDDNHTECDRMSELFHGALIRVSLRDGLKRWDGSVSAVALLLGPPASW